MRARVGKLVDSDTEALGHHSKRVAHDALVPPKRPSPTGPVARENDVHRAARADGALELATAASHSTAVLRSQELGVYVVSKKRLLHGRERTT